MKKLMPGGLPWLLVCACAVAGEHPSTAGSGSPPPASSSDDARQIGVVETVRGSGVLLEAAAYPPGRWRLVPREELERSIIWVSHILIRHEGVPRTAPLSMMPLEWKPEPDAPPRSRAAALERAEDVAAQARAEPGTFGRLAQEYSEDVTTRDAGGSLGGIDAASLIHWPQLLDALAALAPGAVSVPVETEFGFHVLALHAPPKTERRASGRRIVIAYDDAPWLPTFLARRPPPARTRSQAESLAWEVYRKALTQPGEFSRLVDEYTDHQDALRAGDFGSWSNLERAPFPREVERLHSVAEGEVAPPLDSIFGFQIISRAPERPRQMYAMKLIQIATNPMSPDSGAAASAAWSELEGVARTLGNQPGRFAEFQEQLCCSNYVEQWEQGQQSVFAERALEALSIGQMGSAPSDLGAMRFAVLQRVEPQPTQPLPLAYSLPAPEHPDALEFCARTARLDELDRARESIAQELNLPAAAAADLAPLQAVDVSAWQAAAGEERLSFLKGFQDRIGTTLGIDVREQYHAALVREVERTLLQSGPPGWP